MEFPILTDAGGSVARQYGAGTQVNVESRVSYVIGGDVRDPRLVQSHDLRNTLDFMMAGKNPLCADINTYDCAILRTPKTAPRVTLNP